MDSDSLRECVVDPKIWWILYGSFQGITLKLLGQTCSLSLVKGSEALTSSYIYLGGTNRTCTRFSTYPYKSLFSYEKGYFLNLRGKKNVGYLWWCIDPMDGARIFEIATLSLSEINNGQVYLQIWILKWW